MAFLQSLFVARREECMRRGGGGWCRQSQLGCRLSELRQQVRDWLREALLSACSSAAALLAGRGECVVSRCVATKAAAEPPPSKALRADVSRSHRASRAALISRESATVAACRCVREWPSHDRASPRA